MRVDRISRHSDNPSDTQSTFKTAFAGVGLCYNPSTLNPQLSTLNSMTHFSLPRAIVYFLLAGGGFAADLVSKNIVFERLGAPAGSTGWLIDGWFRFRLYTTFNYGALWGVGQGMTWVFALLSLVAVAGVLYWLFFGGAIASWWTTIALGLITAGTLGNLWDRAGMHGLTTPAGDPIFAVRDFLHARFGTFDWAIFNIADVFLVTAFIMLVLQSFVPQETSETDSSQATEPVTSSAK